MSLPILLVMGKACDLSAVNALHAVACGLSHGVARVFAVIFTWWVMGSTAVFSQGVILPVTCILPEQRSLDVRPPGQIQAGVAPNDGMPKTIADFERERESYFLSLDTAIQIALQNAEVIRVLQGTGAGSTGQTIYDPAIQNTLVDVEKSRFDPNVTAGMNLGRSENPGAGIDPVTGAVRIQGADVTTSNFQAGLTERKTNGGSVNLNARVSPTNVAPNAGLLLNPQTPTSLDVTYTQPLLRGRGSNVNLAPIVIARINTERSVYQLKDGVQEMVRSVIDGYWQLVAARVRLWSLEQQVEQLEYAFKQFDVGRQVGRLDLGDTLQAEVSLASFRASLVSTRAEILDREAALFNVLGMPPRPNLRLIPTTAPSKERLEVEWEGLLSDASQNRPDLIQLRLNIESDYQRLQVSCNNTLPQLDAFGLFRMNGLGGRTPGGGTAVSDFLQFNDLQMGLSLQTPLGQRAARAQFRQDQLSFARDQALMRQQLHAVTHDLAACVRALERNHAQYEAFQKVRAASRVNLKRQFDFVKVGGIRTERLVYLNVLQAVTDWGNAINSEASALAAYNSEIANLYLRKGTILEEHDIYFQEQMYASVGPFGRCTDQPYSHCRDPKCREYPHSVALGTNQPRYSGADEEKGAERSFDLETFANGSRNKPAKGAAKGGSGSDGNSKSIEKCEELGEGDSATKDKIEIPDGPVDPFQNLRDLRSYDRSKTGREPAADTIELPKLEELPELPKTPLEEVNDSIRSLLPTPRK